MVLKRDPKEILGRHCWELVHGTQQPIAECPVVRSQRTHRRESMELQQGMQCFEVTADPVLDETAGIAGTVHVITDITGRKTTEEELRKSWLITENIPVGLYLYHLDDVSDDRTLRMIYANPAVKALTGLGPEDVVGRTLDENFPDLRAQGIPQRYAEVVRNQTAITYEDLNYEDDRVLRASFSVRAFPLPGNHVGVVFENITERKRAEDGLRRNEKDLRESQRISHVGSWRLEMTTNKVVWTEELYNMYGFDPSLPPPSYTEHMKLFAPESWDRLSKALARTRDTGIPYTLELETVRKDGSNGWMWVHGQADVDSAGKTVGLWGAAQDITERKRAEEKRRELEERLSQAQKMESVGRLAGGVAHDFNNMLSVIVGHTEMAMGETESDQPLHAHLLEIRKATERSADLTRQLLAFARKQTVSPQVIDMSKTVEGMLNMLRRLIGEDIHLSWLPGVNSWPVKIDPSQVDQILANLCVNARDAITGVGKVTIELENIHIDEAFCTGYPYFISPGDYILLAVNDDGHGMDKKVQDRLFEPFFTTKEVGKGTGLGLATVYGIVKQNKGFINVYSEPGHGTTFRIYLPRHLGDAEQAKAEKPQESMIRGHETVLVVEDELAILDLCRVMLEQQGYEVLAAAMPGEAIRLAEEHSGEIHLLITDMVMPGMNGRDLAKRFLPIYPAMKCLFMSGYTANMIAHQGILDDGVYFIQKPFSRKDLMAKVREVLDQK